MENIDWDKLAAEEEAQQAQGGGILQHAFGGEEEEEEIFGGGFLPAYEEEEFPPSEGEEGGEFDYGEEDTEFAQFIEEDPEEFGFSYAQTEHMGYGDPELGTTLGGKFSKVEKLVQLQTVSKEKLYLNKLKVDLNVFFSFELTNHYSAVTQEVPRYWLKNPRAIASTFYMINSLHGAKLTPEILADYSAQTNIRREDLLRYYRLLEKYVK